MKLKFDIPDAEERGVSPVIGVILMVAITVILAAVIGTFVLGLGDQVSQTAPQATLSPEGTQSVEGDVAIVLSHGGGDDIQSGETDIVVDGTPSFKYESTGSGTLSTANQLVIWGNGTARWGGDPVTTYSASPGGLTDGNEYTVTLVDTGSDQIIAEKSIN